MADPKQVEELATLIEEGFGEFASPHDMAETIVKAMDASGRFAQSLATVEAQAEVQRLRIGLEGAKGNHDRARRALVARAECAETKLRDPWDLEGNAAATAWKARVDAVQKWAEQEYGDASEFPTGLVFALFGSVAAELHEEKTGDHISGERRDCAACQKEADDARS